MAKYLLKFAIVLTIFTFTFLIFITKADASTKYIRDNSTGGDCASIGNWDSSTKTCILTTDFDDTIQVDSDGITLDGSGYSIMKSGTQANYGIFMNGRQYVAIKNLTVSNFTNGIYLYNSSNDILSNNKISNTGYGITMRTSNHNTFEDNILTSNSYGIYSDYTGGVDNIFRRNTANTNRYYGIYLYASVDNNLLEDNTANSNGYDGIYIGGSNNILKNNTTSNNAVSDGSSAGIRITGSANKLTDNTASNNYNGIRLEYANNNTLSSNVANFNKYSGIRIYTSSNNTVTGNTASNNMLGILADYSSKLNTLTGNIASNNENGIYFTAGADNNILVDNIAQENKYQDLSSGCNNVITGTIGSGGRPIKYFSSAVNLSDETLSELILCNADGSRIENVTIDGSPTKQNNGFFVTDTDFSTITNINSSGNYYGMYIYNSSGNTFQSNTTSSDYQGVMFYNSSNNVITNSAVYNNSYGIDLYASSNNTLTNQTISNNSYGFYYYASNGNQIYNNNFLSNSRQIYENPNAQSTGNVFNLDLPIGGNYFSDFDTPAEGCNDANNDKVCDSPYVFTGGQDNYPWTVQSIWVDLPPVISDQNQYDPDGTNVLTEGLTTSKARVTFKANVTDPEGDKVKVEVEVKPFTDQFDGQNILSSGFVNSGLSPTVTAIDLANRDYHWRARGVDSNNKASLWQEFGAIGNVDFSVHLRSPVVIIPGITGTYLNKNYDDHSELWPNIDKLKNQNPDNYLLDLSLDYTGNPYPAFPVSLGDLIRKISSSYFLIPFHVDTFDSLITELTNNGYTEGRDLFVFPYDWRLDNAANVNALSDKINAVLGNSYSKVDIVAHSMGGLIAKDYIVKNGSNKVNKLIFVGTPQVGAPMVFKTLMYGDNMDIPFLDPGTVKTITQNMPSTYELLPSRKYISDNGGYVTDLTTLYVPPPPSLTYDETETFMLGKGSNANMFPLAENLHSDLDNLTLTGVQSYNFIGCGLGTPGHIIIREKQIKISAGYAFVDDAVIKYTSGDKKVPKVSALDQITDTSYFVNKASHSEFPSSDGVRQTIREILLNEPIDSSSNISSDSSVCAKVSGDVVSYHSPVALNIYDSQGRHTGPIASGDIEYGIPGVSYDVLGDAKFAYLPDGDTYTVKGNAMDTGSFDFLIQKVDDGIVTSTASFNDVPLNTLNTNSSISISGSTQTDFNLRVDENGDGTFETNLSPTSILDQTQSADIIKPTTSISIVGTRGKHDWYISNVSVSLSATDDNSGVLKTEYSLDNGVTWNNYSSPISISNEGINTIQYFSVDRAGNSENLHTETIKIDKTNPEGHISFDPVSQKIKVTGTDNLTTPTVTDLGNYDYLIEDESGRSLRLNMSGTIYFSSITNTYQFTGNADSLQYNSDTPIVPPTNAVSYSWINSPTPTVLQQEIAVKDKFTVTAAYQSASDTTLIAVVDQSGTRTENRSGVTLVRMDTNKGEIKFSY